MSASALPRSVCGVESVKSRFYESELQDLQDTLTRNQKLIKRLKDEEEGE